MVSQWSLNDSKSPKEIRSIISIMAVLKNVVVWIVASRPLISKSVSLFKNPLVPEPKEPKTIGIIVSFILHSFSIHEQGLGTYPSFPFLSILL